MTAPYLEVRGLARRFAGGGGVTDVSLALAAGEVLALIGPSGSGKTTTLRLLAGFETPDAGEVRVQGTDVTALDPARRRFGMVFQHYALFPHLDVGGNVAFGLAAARLAPAALAQRVAEALALVELEGLERRAVGELSGGQQQRVALARAIAPAPAVLLLDEPLSNLDPALRERTRGELRALVRRIGITTVLVTHEQEDAFALGDRVALLLNGRVAQDGTPEQLYRAPRSLEVATFVGRGRAVPAVLAGHGDGAVHVEVAGDRWTLAAEAAAGVTGGPGPVQLFARPEALRFDPAGGAPGTITDVRFAGAAALHLVALPGGALLEVAAPVGEWEVGQAVTVRPSRRGGAGLHLFPVAP